MRKIWWIVIPMGSKVVPCGIEEKYCSYLVESVDVYDERRFGEAEGRVVSEGVSFIYVLGAWLNEIQFYLTSAPAYVLRHVQSNIRNFRGNGIEF